MSNAVEILVRARVVELTEAIERAHKERADLLATFRELTGGELVYEVANDGRVENLRKRRPPRPPQAPIMKDRTESVWSTILRMAADNEWAPLHYTAIAEEMGAEKNTISSSLTRLTNTYRMLSRGAQAGTYVVPKRWRDDMPDYHTARKLAAHHREED